VQVQAAIALLVTSSGALLLGWVVAGRVLSPVREITLHARHASEETLDERINLQGPPDELKELADTIDSMLDRLQAAFDSQRRFSAEASHELRTPLAIIRAEVDVALAAPNVTERERQLGTSIRTAADRAERLIDGLLALARSDSTLRDRDRVDLAELVGNVVGEQARAADAAGVELDLALDAAEVDGDRALLWRLIGNLVENAIRYNRRGGTVQVSIGTSGDSALLTVANSGPVIPPEQVEELFQPFQRGNGARRARGSVGLGLAIVRSVAAAHDGEVAAAANPNGGLTVTVRIPSYSAAE
jgi:signal transduction histidine kinase